MVNFVQIVQDANSSNYGVVVEMIERITLIDNPRRNRLNQVLVAARSLQGIGYGLDCIPN
jgi:hypothetical protein